MIAPGFQRVGSWFVAVVFSTSVSACSRETPAPAPKEFELGARRVQVTVPTGWEPLDQGRQKRFRNGEFEIVLRNLGRSSPADASLDQLVDWGLRILDHDDERREIKSRRATTIDGRDAIDIETWNRLDHSNPQRIVLIRDADEVLAFHTVRMAFAGQLEAYDAMRRSIHFVSERR